MQKHLRLSLIEKYCSSDADRFVPHRNFGRSEFRPVGAEDDRREDLIWKRLAEVEKGRRLRGLRHIGRRGDRPAHGRGLTDVVGRFLRTEGRSTRHDRERDAGRKNEPSCPRGRCPCPLRWRPGIHLPVTAVFVRWRWQSRMTSPAPICSTARPSGARAHAARTEKPPHRAGLPDGKAAAYRIALSNRVAPSTAIPSMVGIVMRNIASRRVPAIGANHISMSRAFLR